MTLRARIISSCILLALALAAFPHSYSGFESSNELSHLYLAVSIVNYRSVSIDKTMTTWGDIVDKSARKGCFYSDKAPGASWLAIFPAILLKTVSAASGVSFNRDEALIIARIMAVMLPCFIFFVFLPGRLSLFQSGTGRPIPISEGGTLIRPAENTAFTIALAYAFGTQAWVYSTLLYSHQLAAVTLFAAYMLLRPSPDRAEKLGAREMCAGLLSGFSIALDYPAAWAVLCMIVYVSRRGGAARRGWFWAGLLIPVATLMAYNWKAFGGPFTTGYSFKAYSRDAAVHARGILGIRWPSAASLHGILASRSRGLFFYSPWLIFALPGFFRMARLKHLMADFALCLAVVSGHTLLIGSFGDWPAGWSYGPRHLTPMLPFLLPALVVELEAAKRYERLLIACLLAISVTTTAMAVATFPHVPTLLDNPVTDLFIALIRAGDVGPLVGGIDSWVSLAVMVVLIIAAILWFCIEAGKKHGPSWTIVISIVSVLAAMVWIFSMSHIPPQESAEKHFAMSQVYAAFKDDASSYRELEPLTIPSQPIDLRIYATFMLWKTAEDMKDAPGAAKWRKEYEFMLNQK